MTQTQDPVEETPTTGRSVHYGWALALICIAQLMVVLDATIANIALPKIGANLNITGTNLTWIVTGYALAFGGFLLLGGRLGDIFGRRRMFMVGLALFAVASAIGGLATQEWMLLSSRALQGLGAALASPAALALIQTTFPPGPLRNRAMAMYATMSGVGAAIGLILGGWLTGLNIHMIDPQDGWRLTFLINVPIGLAAAILAPRILNESPRHQGGLDYPGAITGTAGIVALVFGITRAGTPGYGWGSNETIYSLIAAAVLLVTFASIESRRSEPMLPFRVFASRTRAASFAAMMLMPAAMFSMFYFLSQYIQLIKGFTPLQTGFAFLPFSVGIILSAGIVSNLVTKFDPRWISGLGTLLATVGLFGFSRLHVDDSSQAIIAAHNAHTFIGASVNYWTEIMPFIFVMALGMGAVFVPLTLSAVHRLRHEDSGIGSGVLNTMQQVGGALGLAVLSTVGAHYANAHAAAIAGPIAKAIGDPIQAGHASYIGAFPTGATHGFFVGGFMMLGASLIIWIFLNVKHQELQENPDAPVHLG